MAELITVPTFTFNQGDIFNMDAEAERPIHVDFYHDIIQLRQDGEYDAQEKVLIHPTHLKALFKEIQKHLPEAQAMLDKKSANP